MSARVLRAGTASVLALTLVGGYSAPVAAAEGKAGASAQAQSKKAEKSRSHQGTKSRKGPKKPAPSSSSRSQTGDKGKPASPGKSANNGKATAPGQVKSGGSATGKGQGSGQVGSENGTGADGSPPGNNGTIKIAALGDLDTIPNNTPHPGCTFQVEWYGFDEGADVISTVSFAMHAPTHDVGLTVDGPSEVFVGGSPGRGAGNDGLDAVQEYTLSFDGAPHPKQGHHVKLTVSTPHSNGNDTKSKVFWVAACVSESAAGSRDEDASSTAAVTTDSAARALTAGASTQAGTAAGESVQSETAGAVPSSIDAGLRSEWVRSWLPLGVVALGAALLAAALLLRRRARGLGA